MLYEDSFISLECHFILYTQLLIIIAILLNTNSYICPENLKVISCSNMLDDLQNFIHAYQQGHIMERGEQAFIQP